MNWQLILLGCGITAFATSLGAFPALVLTHLTSWTRNILMGFSAGIMLAASCFSLIIPALDLSTKAWGNAFAGSFFTGLMILSGALFLIFCNRVIPHEHFITGPEGGATQSQLRRIWLFVLAITIHNFPEGLAVGSGTGSHSLNLALPILVGVGLQDIPEGFVVAAALLSVGYSRMQSIVTAVITGLVEALAAVIGYVATAFIDPLLPWLLAFAGGAMLFVVVEEMIPEIQLKKISAEASGGLLFGFVLMMILDVALST
jgi:ZIP family zinc transporter